MGVVTCIIPSPLSEVTSLRFTPGLSPQAVGAGVTGHWSHPGIIGRTRGGAGDNCQTLLIATGFSGSHLIIKAARLEIRRQTNYQINLLTIANAEVLRKCQFQRKCPLKEGDYSQLTFHFVDKPHFTTIGWNILKLI